MYCIITSSVMVPELTAKYPRPQKCWPQNFLFIVGNSWRIFLDVFPLIYCVILDTDSWGGAEMNKWIWSLLTWPLIIWMLWALQTSLIRPLTLIPTLPVSTGFRYFVIQMIWYFRSNCVWEVSRYICIGTLYHFLKGSSEDEGFTPKGGN